MSIETRAALEKALANHFASEIAGGFMDRWYLVAHGEVLDSSDGKYLRDGPNGQSIDVTAGLLHYATIKTDQQIEAARAVE